MDLRDVVFRSPRYRLVPADSNEPHYKIDVVTLKSQTTSITAASVVFLMEAKDTEIYLNHTVLTTGAQKTAEQAAGVLATLDNMIAKINKR